MFAEPLSSVPKSEKTVKRAEIEAAEGGCQFMSIEDRKVEGFIGKKVCALWRNKRP